MDKTVFVVMASSGVSDRKCFLGCGKTEKDAIEHYGGPLKSNQWVDELPYEEAVWLFPSFQSEIEMCSVKRRF